MKKFVFLSLMMFIPLSMIAQTKGGMVFEKGTFAQALAKAKQENKMVFVDCYTQWCGPCHFMSTNIMPTDSAGNFMNPKFINLKMDMEHGEGPALQKNFMVKAYPTFIIFNGDGKELGRWAGMSSTCADFFAHVSAAVKGEKVVERTHAQVREEAKPQAKDTIIDEGKGVVFLKSSEVKLEDIFAKAKQENKRILIDFSATWCHACKDMEKTTLRDTRIGNLMNYQFINYMILVDKDSVGNKLADKFKVRALPTYLILNPDGTEFNRIIGSAPVIEFGNKITKALMGEEDAYVKQQREIQEAMEQKKMERKAKLTATPAVTPKTLVNFEKSLDLNKALKKAKKEHKKVYLFVTDNDWKAQYMPKYTFNDKEAADFLNKHCVNLYVDANSKVGDALMEKLSIAEMFPNNLIIDENGTSKGQNPGILRSAKILIESLSSFLK